MPAGLCLAMLLGAGAALGDGGSRLTLHVPSAEGGGFDRTSMAVRRALLAEHLVDEVVVIRSPGAGGLIALAQFVESKKGDANAILIAGRSLLGAASYNRSKLSLGDATPIARLNGTVLAVAVAASSPIHDLGDLIESFRADPALVQWTGGSVGSVDELLVEEIAKALGIDRHSTHYVAVPGGGDDVAQALVAGRVTAAVSSYEELAGFVESGQLRVIAVSGRDRVVGIDAPTLLEYGLDVSFSDWRGAFAPPGLRDDQLQALADLFEKLSDSDAWADEIATHKWQDLYTAGPDFAEFIAAETKVVASQASLTNPAPMPRGRLIRIVGRQYRWAIFAGTIVGLLVIVLAAQRYINHRRRVTLETSLDGARQEIIRVSVELEQALALASNHINDAFARWKLTDAEQEIGWMLLKGLSLRVIAEARGTSERTVRQQARSIYARSGLDNRADLAAFFLEDLCFGHALDEDAPPQPPLANNVKESVQV